jgi:hypothetical protein
MHDILYKKSYKKWLTHGYWLYKPEREREHLQGDFKLDEEMVVAAVVGG